MHTAKSQLTHDTVTVMVFVFVLSSLSMIWPSILALSFGLFLLIQPFGIGQEITMLLGTEVTNVPMVLTSFLGSDPLSILL